MKCDRCGFDNGNGTESGRCMGCGIPIGPGKEDEKKYPYPAVFEDQEPLAVKEFFDHPNPHPELEGIRAIQVHKETWEDGVGANPWSGYRVDEFEATFRLGSPAHRTFVNADENERVHDSCERCGCFTGKIQETTDGGGGWAVYVACVSCDTELYGRSGHHYL